MNKKIQKLYIVLFFVCFFIFSFSVKAEAAIKYWIGTANGNMSVATNWSTTPSSACGVNANTTAPTSADDVEFTSSCTNSATLDQSFSTTINKLTINTGYTGTIRQSSTNTISITGNLTVNAGTITHTANTTTETYKVQLSVGGNFTLASGASITANGLGFSAGYGTGKASNYSGGTYGGIGGGYINNLGIPNRTTYGSITAPVNIGSPGQGALGGGAIRLIVSGLSTINGTISANGANDTIARGAGSGGSVYITTGSITGSGTISANGGGGTSTNIGGGGGRVSVVLSTAGSTFPSTPTITAYGGSTSYAGAAGTVYLQNGNQSSGDLYIRNNNITTKYDIITLLPASSINLNSFSSVVINDKGNLGLGTSNSVDFSNLTLTTSGRDVSYLTIQSGASVTFPSSYTISNYTLNVNTPVTTNNLTVASTGRISHSANMDTEVYKAQVTVNGNLIVDPSGEINADSLGFAVGYGTGKATDTTGGTYGGVGGYATGRTVNSTVYGSVIAPNNIGSPGYEGLAGGAIILNVTNSFVNNGLVSANGQAINNLTRGTGSGGSVYITTGSITGSGTISANGGQLTTQYGGGGGRVSVILTTINSDFSSYAGMITARGGYSTTGNGSGAAGTVFLRTSAQDSTKGTLIIDNNGYSTNTNAVTHINSTVTSGLVTLGQLSLGDLAKVTVNANYPLAFSNTGLSVDRPTIIASSTAVFSPGQSFTVRGTTDFQASISAGSYNITYTGFADNTEVKLLPGTFNSVVTSNVTNGIVYKLNGSMVVSSVYTIPCGVTLDLNGYNWQGTINSATNASCGAILVYNGGTINGIGENGGTTTICGSTGNLSAGTYTNLTITGSGTVCTLTAKTTVSSLITINSGAILSLASQKLSATNITNNGTIRLRGDEYFTISGSLTNNGTTEYVGNGNGIADNYILNGNTLKNLKISFTDTLDSLSAFYKMSSTLSELVGWWKLDESASPAVDSSGYGSSGTWSNTPTATTSVFPNFKFTNPRAVTFSTNKYINLANPTSLNISYPITLSAWIRRAGTGTTQSILGHGTGSYAFYFDASNHLGLTKRGTSSVTSSGTISDTSSWHHVATTYDGSTAKFYIDGILSGSSSFSQSFTAASSLYIAGDPSASEYFNGSIDDVRIYNRTLSSDEVASLAAGYPNEGETNSSLSITGDYTQTAGTFISPLTLSVGGNFSQTGSSIFNPNSGTLSLTKSGGIQIVTASSSLYNLSKTVSAGSTLKITAGSTLTTLATTTFKGTAGATLSVESTNSGTQWKFDPRGNLDLAYMSVKDSNNINASTTNVNPTINAGNFTGITDGGNNTNWLFTLPRLSLSATGNQLATTSLPITNQYLGGSFLATTTTGESVITSIRLKQNGSLPTSFISSLKIYYKDSVGGLCSNTSSLPVGSSLFGTAGAWSDNFATTTGSMTISATPTCIYIVFSLQGTLSLNTIYNTIDFEVANPSTDVISSGVTVSPATAVNIPGSTVVSGSISGVPAVSLSVSSTSVPTNSSVLLSWSTTKATNCSASASPANSNWTGAKDLSGSGVSTGPLTEHRVYSFALECSNSLGTSTSRVYVTAIHPLAPIITISTNPNAVASGASSTLTWSTAGNQNTPSAPCVASGSWLGNKDFSGNLSLSNITSTRYYTLTCANGYGSTSKTAAIIVNSVVPDYCTDGIFNGDETSVDYGGSCNSGDSGESVSNVSFGDFITLTMSDPTINPTVFYFMDDGVSNALYMRQGTLENTVIRKLTADGLNVKNGSFTKLDCGGSNDCRGVKIRLELEKSGSTSDLQNFVVEKTFQTTSFLRKK